MSAHGSGAFAQVLREVGSGLTVPLPARVHILRELAYDLEALSERFAADGLPLDEAAAARVRGPSARRGCITRARTSPRTCVQALHGARLFDSGVAVFSSRGRYRAARTLLGCPLLPGGFGEPYRQVISSAH